MRLMRETWEKDKSRMIKPVVCDLDVHMTNVVNKSTAMQTQRQIRLDDVFGCDRKLHKVVNWIIPSWKCLTN